MTKAKNPQEQDADFWDQQIEHYHSAGGSKAAYCRRHKLTYYRFLYWWRKWQKHQPSSPPLIPITLSDLSATPAPSTHVLASVGLSNGARLFIHDKEILLQLISSMV